MTRKGESFEALKQASADQAEQVAEMMKSTMQSIAPDLGINLDVDTTIGENWGEV